MSNSRHITKKNVKFFAIMNGRNHALKAVIPDDPAFRA